MTNKVPNIRFKGFTDDWEQRKLSELYNKNTEKNEELISYDKTISIATMTYKNGGNGASDKSLKAYKVLRVGDLAFEGHTNKKFKYGRFVLNDIGTGIMSPRFSTLRPIQCMPISFWKYYIHYEPIMQKILVNSTKAGTMMNELVIPEFLKQSILVPSMSEQQKIGEYLSNLDHLITLHQRKCEQTKELKKFMLQKMFPKKGEKNPEIRFPGFTDDWEQRKAGEIFKSVSDKGYTDLPVLSASQELGMILRDEIGIDIKYDESSIKNYKRVKPGQFVIHLRSFQGGFAWSDIEGITSPAYTILDYQEPEEHCSKFWKIVLTSPMFITRLETVTYGIRDGRSISFTDFSTLNLNVPSITEQQKIGKYFSKLDNLITLHQRKCEQLKELKKFMLQNMFPKKG